MSQVHIRITGDVLSEELEVLRIVTGRLDPEGIPYMVTGSMAVNYYSDVSLERSAWMMATRGLG